MNKKQLPSYEESALARKQGRLEGTLEGLREILDGPLDLRPSTRKLVEKAYRDVAARVYWYLGACFALKVTIPGEDKRLHDEIRTFIEKLGPNVKSGGKRGRPLITETAELSDWVLAHKFIQRGSEPMEHIVNDAIKGGLLDKKKSSRSHVKRIQRLAKRLAVADK